MVSIAIPFFNPGAFFYPAIQSIFAQTYDDWELLLLDDGGWDGSSKMCRSIVDPRVRVVSDGTNRGLSFRLNQAAELARGEYLFRMDADDIMHPERVASQLRVLESSSKDTVLGTACYSIDDKENVVGWRPVRQIQSSGYDARHSFFHPTVAAPTEWFRRYPYSEDYVFRRSEDAELWCRTSSFTEFKWINEPLLFYREQGVFSLDNYLVGQQGLLHLIESTIPHKSARLPAILSEKIKMVIARAFHALNWTELLVQRRYEPLNASQRLAAQIALADIHDVIPPGLRREA